MGAGIQGWVGSFFSSKSDYFHSTETGTVLPGFFDDKRRSTTPTVPFKQESRVKIGYAQGIKSFKTGPRSRSEGKLVLQTQSIFPGDSGPESMVKYRAWDEFHLDSQNFDKIEVDEQKKTITFLPKENYNLLISSSKSKRQFKKMSQFKKNHGNIQKIVLDGTNTEERVFDDAIKKLKTLRGKIEIMGLDQAVSTTNLETPSQSPACLLTPAQTSGTTVRRLAVNAALSEPKAVSAMSPLSMTLLGAGFILGGFIVANCLRKRRRSLRPLLPRYDGE